MKKLLVLLLAMASTTAFAKEVSCSLKNSQREEIPTVNGISKSSNLVTTIEFEEALGRKIKVETQLDATGENVIFFTEIAEKSMLGIRSKETHFMSSDLVHINFDPTITESKDVIWGLTLNCEVK